MAVSELTSIGSIATHINECFQLSAGVSGNVIEIVDQARQFVANYAGVTIGSNNIAAQYQPVILDYSRADVIDLQNAQSGGERLSLGELSIDDSGDKMNARQYRLMGDLKLRSIGKKVQFSRSLS